MKDMLPAVAQVMKDHLEEGEELLESVHITITEKEGDEDGDVRINIGNLKGSSVETVLAILDQAKDIVNEG